jgi:hypothetical protein
MASAAINRARQVATSPRDRKTAWGESDENQLARRITYRLGYRCEERPPEVWAWRINWPRLFIGLVTGPRQIGRDPRHNGPNRTNSSPKSPRHHRGMLLSLVAFVGGGTSLYDQSHD